MKRATAFLAAFLTTVCLFADDITTVSGKKYLGVTVSRVEPDGPVVITSDGIEKILFADLPADLRKKYGFDPLKAAQFVQTQQAAAAQRREAASEAAAAAQEKAQASRAAQNAQSLQGLQLLQALATLSKNDDAELLSVSGIEQPIQLPLLSYNDRLKILSVLKAHHLISSLGQGQLMSDQQLINLYQNTQATDKELAAQAEAAEQKNRVDQLETQLREQRLDNQ